MRRAERLSLQDDDDGDPDDTVFVAHYNAAGANSEQYHEAGCRYLRRSRQGSDKDPDSMSREDAQHRWLAPCRACVLKNAEFSLSDGERGDGQVGGS